MSSSRPPSPTRSSIAATARGPMPSSAPSSSRFRRAENAGNSAGVSTIDPTRGAHARELARHRGAEHRGAAAASAAPGRAGSGSWWSCPSRSDRGSRTRRPRAPRGRARRSRPSAPRRYCLRSPTSSITGIARGRYSGGTVSRWSPVRRARGRRRPGRVGRGDHRRDPRARRAARRQGDVPARQDLRRRAHHRRAPAARAARLPAATRSRRTRRCARS